jgi:tetratricopeptide (TPR) repeat protein
VSEERNGARLELAEALREAYSLLKNGRLPEAEQLFLRALEADEKNLMALNALGFICYGLAMHEKGQEYCLRALEHHPGNSYAYKGLGLHRGKRGEVQAGIEDLKKAIHYDPDFIEAYHDLAFVYYQEGNIENARIWLERALRRPVPAESLTPIRKFIDKIPPQQQK